MKLSVPSLVYAVQNNMAFLALSNLDAAVYQVSGGSDSEKRGLLKFLLTLPHIIKYVFFLVLLMEIPVSETVN